MNAETLAYQMTLERYELFKAQDPQSSNFDVTFEVDGKLIYANKYVLETISKPFSAMLSDRWKSKDDVIKVDTYSYENFYTFLTFIYSGDCELTYENFPIMVDMSEFYDINLFKCFCDDYISKMEYNSDKIFIMVDLVVKYSGLPKTKTAINEFVLKNFPSILQSNQFMNLKKTSFEYLVALQRGPKLEEQLFEAACKWAEKQVLPQQQSTKRKRKFADTDEAIKAELSGILPHINFTLMNISYFSKYVVPKGFFSLDELSAILCDHLKITVTVRDRAGQTITGSFVDTLNFYNVINGTYTPPSFFPHLNYGAFYYTFDLTPPIPSDLKKNENVQFYLVLADLHLKIKKPAQVAPSDYLICEMAGASDFIFDKFCFASASRN